MLPIICTPSLSVSHHNKLLIVNGECCSNVHHVSAMFACIVGDGAHIWLQTNGKKHCGVHRVGAIECTSIWHCTFQQFSPN